MPAQLRVLANTVFKLSVQESSVLPADAKVPVYQGQEFAIATYNIAENAHVQLVFTRSPFPSHPDALQWFAFKGHVELIDGDRIMPPPQHPQSWSH